MALSTLVAFIQLYLHLPPKEPELVKAAEKVEAAKGKPLPKARRLFD